MFFGINTIPSLLLGLGVAVSGLGAIGPALDGYAQPYRDAAKIECFAKSQVYVQLERPAAEAACIAKKLDVIEKQIAPAKTLVASFSY